LSSGSGNREAESVIRLATSASAIPAKEGIPPFQFVPEARLGVRDGAGMFCDAVRGHRIKMSEKFDALSENEIK